MVLSYFFGQAFLQKKVSADIVLITDAVCNVTDVYALQKLMTQLRNRSIACSFVQVKRIF